MSRLPLQYVGQMPPASILTSGPIPNISDLISMPQMSETPSMFGYDIDNTNVTLPINQQTPYMNNSQLSMMGIGYQQPFNIGTTNAGMNIYPGISKGISPLGTAAIPDVMPGLYGSNPMIPTLPAPMTSYNAYPYLGNNVMQTSSTPIIPGVTGPYPNPYQTATSTQLAMNGAFGDSFAHPLFDTNMPLTQGEDRDMKIKIGKYVYKKFLNEWFYSDFKNICKYFKIDDGKNVKFITSLSDYKKQQDHTKSSVDKKLEYIKENLFTKKFVARMIEQFIMDHNGLIQLYQIPSRELEIRAYIIEKLKQKIKRKIQKILQKDD